MAQVFGKDLASRCLRIAGIGPYWLGAEGEANESEHKCCSDAPSVEALSVVAPLIGRLYLRAAVAWSHRGKMLHAGVYEEEHRAWSISRPAQSTLACLALSRLSLDCHRSVQTESRLLGAASVPLGSELGFYSLGGFCKTQDPETVVLGDISNLAEIDLKVARASLDALVQSR